MDCGFEYLAQCRFFVILGVRVIKQTILKMTRVRREGGVVIPPDRAIRDTRPESSSRVEEQEESENEALQPQREARRDRCFSR